MRIYHLSTMTSYYGGEVCLTNLAAGLDARGHELTCVVRPESKLRWELEARGLRIRCLPMVDWFEPVTVSRLSRLLKRERVDILHTHMPRDYYIAAVATLGSATLNIGTRHQLHPITYPRLKKPFLNRFSGMIAVSEAVRRGLVSGGALADDRVFTVPNGIPWPGPDPRGRSLRDMAGVGAEVPVVGLVGRLSAGKGVETLLKAAACLTGSWPDLRIFLVGDASGEGRYREHLEAVARRLGLDNRVHFFGYMDGAAHLCADFDVQAVCSRAEPFGLVTLEALSQGRPVVATDTGGSPEIVRDGVEGFLVPPGDSRILARRLDCLLDSPGLRREMGQRGRARVHDGFSRDRMIEGVEKVYVGAMARGLPAKAATAS